MALQSSNRAGRPQRGTGRAPARAGGRSHEDLGQSLDRAHPSLVEALSRVAQVGNVPLRAAFLARALNALAGLAPRLDDDALARAAGAPSDYEVLLSALREPEAIDWQPDDRVLRARMRGLAMRKQLLEAEGGTLTAPQMAEHLGISRQAVDKRRQAGKLLAIDVGRHGYLYPAWQLGANGVLPGLGDVLADLSTPNPWMRLAFFLTGDPRLDGATPLQELRRGSVEAVRRAARAYGEHAAA